MKRGKMLVAAVGVALVVSAAASIGYLRFGREITVPVVEAAQGTLKQRVVGPGTVQTRVPVSLSARITATVKQVNVDVGDAVRRGQEVVILDDRDLVARRGVVAGQQAALARNLDAAKATVVKAHADLELARSRQQRDAELLRTGFVSQAVLDASNASLKAASASLDTARASQSARESEVQALSHEGHYADAMLSHARITAPMDGIVIARQVEVGTTVVPGSVLLRIVDPAALWVATRMDESLVGRIQPGQAASIRLRTGETLAGKVARIARQSDAATRELEVDVAFDAPPQRFAIDQEAEVAIVVGDAAGIVLPLAALTRDRTGRQGVLVIEDSRTEFRSVQIGSNDGSLVLVSQGLRTGERVVARAEGVGVGIRVRPLEAAGL